MILNASKCIVNKQVIECDKKDMVCVIEPDDDFITFSCPVALQNIHIKNIHEIGFIKNTYDIVAFDVEEHRMMIFTFTELSHARIKEWVGFKRTRYLNR